ncbi:MAG: hypothetical protein HY896_02660 [Deltaproteobacteria bacterium]|nr:hypothetical protein [Deltaproteobacteria bacterium]
MTRTVSRNVFLRIAIAALFLMSPISFLHPGIQAGYPDDSLEKILASTESLFKAMREKNYPAIWAGLSVESRKVIMEEAGKAIEKSTGEKVPDEELLRDFLEGGPVAEGYWTGFLKNFDPVIVLEKSRWEKGRMEENRAEILLTYKASDKPAVLKLFREDGAWKVGLVETFWGR